MFIDLTVYEDQQGGAVKYVNTMSEGAVFGETALVTSRVRSASVCAVTFCEMQELTKEDLHTLMGRHADVKTSVTRMVQNLKNRTRLETKNVVKVSGLLATQLVNRLKRKVTRSRRRSSDSMYSEMLKESAMISRESKMSCKLNHQPNTAQSKYLLTRLQVKLAAKRASIASAFGQLSSREASPRLQSRPGSASSMSMSPRNIEQPNSRIGSRIGIYSLRGKPNCRIASSDSPVVVPESGASTTNRDSPRGTHTTNRDSPRGMRGSLDSPGGSSMDSPRGARGSLE